MRNAKTKVTPVIIGATGIISKALIQYLNNIPGEHNIKELQKTAIVGTAPGSANVEVQNVYHGK
jgi:hypothetical protein